MSPREYYKLGLLGWPVGHSLSPVMHTAALQALGLVGEYRARATTAEDLARVVCGLAGEGYCGVNVTVPHKQAVLALVDELDAEARAVGAVNTIVIADDGRLRGYNTDVSGFAEDVAAQGWSVSGRTVAVLGAGGAARACVVALVRAGAAVRVYNRTLARAEVLVAAVRAHWPAAELSAQSLAALAEARDCALVVNATTAGMAPLVAESPWPVGVAYPRGVPLYDMVYAPARTTLMGQAEAAGAPVVNGLGMLVRQGAAALTLWTGRAAPVEVMRAALLERVGG